MSQPILIIVPKASAYSSFSAEEIFAAKEEGQVIFQQVSEPYVTSARRQWPSTASLSPRHAWLR